MKLKIVSTIVGVLVVVLSVVMLYISYANTAVRMEETISRFHQNSQNTLSSYTLKLREAAQVPEMYTESLRDLIESTFQGRYGADGSNAMFQWIQEQNLQVDSSVFLNLQSITSSGRDEFRLSQDRKIEACTTYQRMLRQPISGYFMRSMGYPTIDMSTCNIVLDQQTIDTFDSGVATEIRLR